MDNVLLDRSASGFDFRLWNGAVDDGCRSFAMMSTPRSIYSSFPYVPPQLPPFQYAPCLQPSLSLPPLPPRRPALLPLPPPAMARTAKYAAPPPPPPAARRTGLVGEYKRKKPRAPRPPGEEPPRAAQRMKPLERAAPLPPATAVDEALDDLEREVTRGFVEDLVLALAPPPSSLPLPNFSLVRAAAVKAAAASCAAV
ncbi:unnamed protein product [Urochloa decumbens]|uniref:Uncharacterized protein n=1 Tax=Urochloa decumbens TaxID=240449 RepID=A0ABC8XUB3_9POAL